MFDTYIIFDTNVQYTPKIIVFFQFYVAFNSKNDDAMKIGVDHKIQSNDYILKFK